MDYHEKRALIEQLMDHWQDYFDFGGSETGGTGDGAGPVISSMSTYSSVVELNRCLELMKRMAQGHYKHLIGYYRSEWRTVKAPELRRVGGRWVPRIDERTGRPLLDPDPKKMRRERVVPGWVNRRMVDRALDFLVGAWDRKVVLELPPALTRKLRPLAVEEGEEGWTEYIPERDGPKKAA